MRRGRARKSRLTPRRLHGEATAKAKELFGDIVSGVYVTVGDCWDGDSASKELDSASIGCLEGQITYDSECIWIQFTNGRVVAFHNSEWAHMESRTLEESYEA